MWSGRFREPLDPLFDHWQRSFSFDRALLWEETTASRAHALALENAGALSGEEAQRIVAALEEIASSSNGVNYAGAHRRDNPRAEQIERSLAECEDIHHYVERELVSRVGDLGLKLHTGRSRNEQIATDLRLYIRDRSRVLVADILAWTTELIAQAEAHADAVMPAYTHLQRAEPVLVAHWLLAYVEMSLRDVSRLEDCVSRLNLCPLGSGAIAGATLALDRSIAARELGFDGPTMNSMDATSDRDFVLEYLNVLTLLGVHMSRFAEEMTLFATAEFGFIVLPEAYSTGSSAMPQKQNPDLTELIRAKVGRLSGAAQTVLLALKGLPLAYNKDMQETQEPVFAATATAHTALLLLARFTRAVRFRTDRMRTACERGYMNGMAAATYLTTKGIPFRTAHERIGAAVRLGMETGRELGDLGLDELRSIEPAFDADVYDAITLKATLDCHDVHGGTATPRVRAAVAETAERVRQLIAKHGTVAQPGEDAAEMRHADT